MLKRFLHDERGITAIEYAVIAGMMFLAVVTALGLFSANANAMFGHISDAVTGATSGS